MVDLILFDSKDFPPPKAATVRRLMQLSGVVSLVLLAGCYQAVINTGRPASGQTGERPWAHSFLAGLVPPSVTDAASACPNGVARVETQHSFLNVVAQMITFSIYTPMTIIVQCAGSVPEDAASEEVVHGDPLNAAEATREAVRRSIASGSAIYIDLQ
jgi:hypothetical protein